MLLVTGDLHNSDNPRDAYRFKWFDSFIRHVERSARSGKCTGVVILGDLTEQKERHSAFLVNAIVDRLYKIAQIVPVIGLQGNHDYKANPEDGFWPFLSHIEGVSWITHPTAITLDGVPTLLLPHTRDYKRDWYGAAQVWAIDAVDKAQLIFCHNTFEGAVSETGARLSGIPTNIFPAGATIISGDIHKPQKVGPVTYVGAPYLCNFGDDYIPRIIQLDQTKITSLGCPGIQKRVVDISGEEDLQLQTHVQKGDMLKIRVHLKTREQWPTIQESVIKWVRAKGYVIHALTPVLAGAKPARLEKVTKRSDAEILKKYASVRGLSNTMLNKGLELCELSSDAP